MMSSINTNFTPVLSEINSIDFGLITIDPSVFANVLQKYIGQGSMRYTLSKEDIQVYANPSYEFPGKENTNVLEIDGKLVPNTLYGLLASGTRFLDAVIFLSLDDQNKPDPEEHPIPKDKKKEGTFAIYNNHAEIAKCMFFSFFYLLTRARAPGRSGDANSQVVPSFLKNILSISKSPAEVADYLGSFDINKIDPSWIKHVNLKNMGRESLNRFGLGVAGYRLTSPFKLRIPDHPEHKIHLTAIEVAKSFATEPADWYFHPATRNPDLLTKYGNINKNLSNLLLVTYKEETLQMFVNSRVLYQLPVLEPAYTNYTTWDTSMSYKCVERIFK